MSPRTQALDFFQQTWSHFTGALLTEMVRRLAVIESDEILGRYPKFFSVWLAALFEHALKSQTLGREGFSKENEHTPRAEQLLLGKSCIDINEKQTLLVLSLQCPSPVLRSPILRIVEYV